MDLNFGKCCGSKKVCRFSSLRFVQILELLRWIKIDVLLTIIMQKESWRSVMLLAYQSLGVVYGDLSISPLYVFKSTFAEDIRHSETNEEIYGVLSFVFWTLTLVPLLKYVFIVLRADDNGEGEWGRERLREVPMYIISLFARCLCSNVEIFLRWDFCFVFTDLPSCQSKPSSKPTSLWRGTVYL